MAAITWRNINAPSQKDAARLAIAGNQMLTTGLKDIGQAANQFHKKNVAEQQQVETDSVNNLLNNISQMGSAELAEAKASGAFNQDTLLGSGMSQDNVNKVFGEFNNQENVIYTKGKEAFSRDLEVSGREHQITAQNLLGGKQQVQQLQQEDTITSIGESREDKANAAVLQDVLSNFAPDTSLDAKLTAIEKVGEGNDFSPAVINAAKEQARSRENESRLSTADQAQVAASRQAQAQTARAQYDVMESDFKELEQLRASTQKNPEQGSEEFAKQQSSLNSYIDKTRQGDRYFGKDLDEVKSEVANYGRTKNASPAQVQAALSSVIDGDGDYAYDAFTKQLDEIVSSPASSRVQARINAKLKGSGFDNIDSLINARQTELNKTKIGLSNYVLQQQNTSSQALKDKLKQGR